MIRNWGIIRAILVRLEDSKTPNAILNANEFPDYSEQEVAYNMRLLSEAGFIKANILESGIGDGKICSALARHLENAGHELLDTIRNDSVWEEIKDKFETKNKK